MTTLEFANLLFSSLTIFGQAVIVILVISRLLKNEFTNSLLRFVEKYALVFAFVVALIAMSGSLFYSEVIGFEPCELCWFQRIFMYPQVFLLGLALLKKDRSISQYIILLSAIGAVISFYHYLMQRGFITSSSCAAVGYSVDCAQNFVLQFGYITIPLMAFTAFLLIICLLVKPRA